MEVNIYEQMSAETKKALDALVDTLPWHQLGEDDPVLDDLQIHTVGQLEKVILGVISNQGLVVEGKTALQQIREDLGL